MAARSKAAPATVTCRPKEAVNERAKWGVMADREMCAHRPTPGLSRQTKKRRSTQNPGVSFAAGGEIVV